MIPKEIAEVEVKGWLDFKKVKESKRADNKKNIEELVNGVAEGSFIIDSETKQIKYKLMFPVKNDKGVETVTELIFEPRVIAKKISDAIRGVNSEDTFGFFNGYAQALTGQPKNVIAQLDSEDYNMIRNILVFFM
jgi:hypothetical protein